MKNLISKLKDATVELKEEFILKTKEWAEGEYDRCFKMTTYSDIDWCHYFGIMPHIHNANSCGQFASFPKGFHNSSNARSLDNLKKKINGVLRGGKEESINRQVKAAETHYESSVEKLAYRIKEKGLDLSIISLHSTKLDLNFETTVTDGVKSVREFTILAWGEINKPHYRYLIK